ncbi:AsnC family transcriptional regulator [Natronomonas gomsonensis]|jgi:Lrp/AsnC family leucine-responsive transcriptional regulator|uniref:AsnC family transcriptional regulator n=1 Tax=Natronomonas gomsonensis TaxID=1046043 RepID=UPI0020CA8D74|nr:AsnC family transcriptional regulator [Natronomonas gomsonensis]MCY4729231.1 AsnC family transcriptional regulator [Natronomonas gomsonensis]
MRDLDETDRRLLRLLLDDGRRPYSDLAEEVGLSAPAVSDRIDRLRELGIVERFTVDIDRSRLSDGVRVAVTLDVTPGETTTAREALGSVDGVEHVFATADSRLFVVASVPDGDVERHLAAAFDTGAIEAVSASPLVAADWHPALGEATLGMECAECGNTVTSEGVTATLDGERYEFCCGSCEARFVERYEELKEGA